MLDTARAFLACVMVFLGFATSSASRAEPRDFLGWWRGEEGLICIEPCTSQYCGFTYQHGTRIDTANAVCPKDARKEALTGFRYCSKARSPYANRFDYKSESLFGGVYHDPRARRVGNDIVRERDVPACTSEQCILPCLDRAQWEPRRCVVQLQLEGSDMQMLWYCRDENYSGSPRQTFKRP
jgi:hypothetical protein